MVGRVLEKVAATLGKAADDLEKRWRSHSEFGVTRLTIG